MYPHPKYKNDDTLKMLSVIAHFPLATLITVVNDLPFITKVPLIYDASKCKLVGHIDKQNPQMVTLSNGASITALFDGPSCYISPSVYSTKQLPTYNYIYVKITGILKLINNPAQVKKAMVDMTAYLEGVKPQFELDVNDERMDRLINYIQTFEIEITDWEGRFKLSQEKSDQDLENTKQELERNMVKANPSFINSIYKTN